MPVSEGFPGLLAPRLAIGNSLYVHHISAPPTPCPPLFAPAPGFVADKTWCESHFLAFSQNPVGDVGTGSSLLVLGLEVLIFTTDNLTTIFVSKADSTGYLHRQSISSKCPSVALATTSAFLEFLIGPRLKSSRLVLSLFARSQNQYLFPGSIENDSKRILDDRQLIKWWCKVVDHVIRAGSLGVDVLPLPEVKAYVVVPGCEKAETRAFFPSSARFENAKESKWANEFPNSFFNQGKPLPLRCLIPRLPDDPKARFLDDLDGSQISSDGSWNGIKSLAQFWEMMSYRQECSAGRLVGFIWITFFSPEQEQPADVKADKIEGDPPVNDAILEIRSIDKTTHKDMPAQKDTNQDTPDVRTGQEEPGTLDVSAAAGLSERENESSTVPSSDKPPSWPETTKGEIVLSHEQYSTLMDHLLQLDFSGVEIAMQSTKDWIDRAKEAAEKSDFGIMVEGSYVATPSAATSDPPVVPVANLLTAVRKKRKADPPPSGGTEQTVGVNSIGLDSIRKKPKP